MSPKTKTFLSGVLTGALGLLVLLWIFPGLVPGISASGAGAGNGGSGGAGDPAATTLERLRHAGVVRVGFANEAPYAWLDAKTGKLTGESPEIARVVLARLGIPKIEGVLTEFGALIPGLKAGRFDIIAAGMYITPPRCQEVGFSNPTYGIGEAFVVAKGNPRGLHSYADVASNEHATLGVVTGAIERDYALKSKVPEARLEVFPDAVTALEAVAAGRVDAYAGTSLTVNDLLGRAKNPKLERAAPFTDPVIDGKTVRGYGAFAFRKGDDALRTAFDHELEGFLGSDAHESLVAPFGFGATELPQGKTAAELCGGKMAEATRP